MDSTTKRDFKKKLKRFDIPGHAHELTFSCYHRYNYLEDPILCNIFLKELDSTRNMYKFRLWAYVLMPSHVHLLIYPYQSGYRISQILQTLKGRTSKRYSDSLIENDHQKHNRMLIKVGDQKVFRLWQAGGGFDRNLWDPKAIHNAINYIETNPVRSRLVDSLEKWPWSSFTTRLTRVGLVPDECDIPMFMK